MEKTAMPVVAGILNIVSGVLSLLGFVALLIGSIAVGLSAIDIYWGPEIGIAFSVLIILTVLALVVGVLAIVGGVYALLRKHWGLALAGSICSLLATFVLGVAAVILIALSKNEFE
ncbi:MAG: hypothetical protein ACXABY_34225 [Candidatus Thorarchaeota archaeon]